MYVSQASYQSIKKVWTNLIVYRFQGTKCIITVCDSFPLPRIEEALQVVKSAVWFTSFNLAQDYLQLAMDEADIMKTAFHMGSSSLYTSLVIYHLDCPM